MLIKYKGGRSHYEVSFNRMPYYFTLENNRTLDIKDQNVINYIFSLPNRQEFEAVDSVEEKKVESFECEICKFVAKSAQGLIVHRSTKHKKK